MTELEYAIQRLTAWIRDFGPQQQPVFIADLTLVVAAARDCLGKESVTVYGRILSSEISPEFGTTVGRVECPDCQEEIGIGVMQQSDPKCRCGFEWTLDTVAVGTKSQ